MKKLYIYESDRIEFHPDFDYDYEDEFSPLSRCTEDEYGLLKGLESLMEYRQKLLKKIYERGRE